MKIFWYWIFLLLPTIALTQERVEFQLLTKTPPFFGLVIGQVNTDQSIFVRDVENYYHYSFEVNTWSKFKFKVKPVRLTLWSSSSLNMSTLPKARSLRVLYPIATSEIPLVHMPSFGKVMLFAHKIEMLDTDALTLSYLEIDGNVHVSEGIAAQGDKVFLVGGKILLPKQGNYEIQPSSKFTVFDAAKLSFENLPPLPLPLVCKGEFTDAGLIFFTGSTPTPTSTSTVLRYDSLEKNWDNLGSLPINISQTAISYKGTRFYLLGTRGVNGFLGIYDVRDNTYSELPTNIRLTGGTALVRRNKLYYFGGINVDFPGSIDQGMYVVDLDTLPVTPTRSDN